ncbi:MAG: hypothetical protein U0002_07765 [Thermoanaerobaculia bacterium]
MALWPLPYHPPMSLSRTGPAWRLAAVATPLLLLVSCFEAPVEESLDLEVLKNGFVHVVSEVAITRLEKESNARLERRLAALRREVGEGQDAWARRFAELEPVAERFTWEKRLGTLFLARRSAVVEPDKLARLFGDTPLRVTYTVDEERRRAELSITPGPSSRASRGERRQVEAALGEWSQAIARYLRAGRALFAYTEEHPERARACFGALLTDVLPDAEKAALPPLGDDEKPRVEGLGKAMEEAFQVLLVAEGQDHSLDELSRLVYDPFPAPLRLRLPAPASEVEGFEKAPDGGLEVPVLGFWAALSRLEGRWLAPDPLLVYVKQRRAGTELDLPGFLAQERRAASETELPGEREVREAIEETLSPALTYHAVWEIDPSAEPGLPWEGR